jgi:hypothetical protein
MLNTLLARNAQRVLNQALESATGGILVRIHASGDIIQLARYGRSILYYFKSRSPDYAILSIEIMGENELWIGKGIAQGNSLTSGQ